MSRYWWWALGHFVVPLLVGLLTKWLFGDFAIGVLVTTLVLLAGLLLWPGYTDWVVFGRNKEEGKKW